jgi:hypothetical protein
MRVRIKKEKCELEMVNLLLFDALTLQMARSHDYLLSIDFIIETVSDPWDIQDETRLFRVEFDFSAELGNVDVQAMGTCVCLFPPTPGLRASGGSKSCHDE